MSYMIDFVKKIEVKWQPHKIQLFLYWFLALYPRPRTLLHYLKKCKTALTSQHLTLFLLFAFLYLSLFVHFDQMSEGSQALKVTLLSKKTGGHSASVLKNLKAWIQSLLCMVIHHH